MSEKKFDFIEPLEERPTMRRAKSTSTIERVIMEFVRSGYKYASVKDAIVEEYKSPKGCARAIGRVASSLRKKGNIDEPLRVYSSDNKVFLVKE